MAYRDCASLPAARIGSFVRSALCVAAAWFSGGATDALALPADLGKQEVHRVLPPAAGPIVEAAFAKAAPAFRLLSAELKQDRVLATVDAAGTQRRLELTDPQRGCDGTVAGPWCVRFQGSAPADAAALITALGSEDRAVWQQVTVTVGVPEGWTATGADAAVHDRHPAPMQPPAESTPEQPAPQQVPAAQSDVRDPEEPSLDGMERLLRALVPLLLLGGLFFFLQRRGRK